jgi:flagellar biosynthesis protein FliQ
MSEASPPRGGVVPPSSHDAFEDFIGRRKDWIVMFNRVVRPALFGGISVAVVLMVLMVGLAFGVAAMRAAFALPVGDMSLGFAPLLLAALPIILHPITRSFDKRARVAD